VSAAEFFRRHRHDVALGQLAALLADTPRRRALAWMPEVPPVALADLLLELDYRGTEGEATWPAT
jgi:hypothetical protein